MASTSTKAPEAMDISELFAELEACATARADDREVCILRALRAKVASSFSTGNDIPLGWLPYGQGPRGLDALKE